MEKQKMYILKKNKKGDFDSFGKLGYKILINQNDNSMVVFKEKKFIENSQPYNFVKNVLNSKGWQKYAFEENEALKQMLEDLNIEFETVIDSETGKSEKKVVENETFVEIASNWRIECNVEGDALISYTPMYDALLPFDFYNSKLLDEFFGEEIEELKTSGLIKKIDAKEALK